MGRGHGGTGVGGSGRGGGGNYQATVTVLNYKGDTRQLTKSFKTQKEAEDWVDKVGAKFDNPGKAGFATWGSVDKTGKNGTEYDVSPPVDFAKLFEKKDAKAFKSGYK